MKIVEGNYDGLGLVQRNHGRIVPYRALPDNAKKSLAQYMIVDGENHDYKSQKYAYAEVPTKELTDWIANYFHQEYGEDANSDWWAGELSFTPTYPPESLWPVIISSIGFEDGAHRLERYVKLGLEKIPVIFIV